MPQQPQRVLFSTTLDNQIWHFHVPYIQMLKARGNRVDVVSAGDTHMPFCDNKYTLPFTKKPLSLGNLRAWRALRRLLSRQHYDLVHCHSPAAGAVTRLAVRTLPRRKRPLVFYTAHGFHFYRGAPLTYWLLIYPLEKILARWTDCLLVMNREDHARALRGRFRAGRIVKVPGVGVDLSRIDHACAQGCRRELRAKYGYKREAYLLFYAAELSERKQQRLLLDVVARLAPRIPHLRLILAGRDLLDGALQKEAQRRGLAARIDFVGHLENIPEWLLFTDVVTAASRQEGLPINLIEAMACGRAIVATAVRGHVDLIDHEINGLLTPPGDADTMAEAVYELYRNPEAAEAMAAQAVADARRYGLDEVLPQVGRLYDEVRAAGP